MTLARQPQGLYHPENEHDACGVGFVAHIKGKKIARHRRAGPDDPARTSTTAARSAADPSSGRRRRHPDPDPRPLLPRGDGEAGRRSCRRPASTASAWCSCRSEPASRIACEQEIERAIKDEGQVLLGWRDVPVDNSDLAEPAKQVEPVIRQVFIGRGRGVTVTDALERKLYIIRKSVGPRHPGAEAAARQGVLRAVDVGAHHRLQGHAARRPGRRVLPRPARTRASMSALALVHQRFSTNTFPTWDLAHPFRLICHNGEINTLRGNVNWIRAREGAIVVAGARRRPDEALAADLRRPVRLGLVRQRARAAGDGRLLARARDDDDDPRGVGAAHADGRAAAARSTNTTPR